MSLDQTEPEEWNYLELQERERDDSTKGRLHPRSGREASTGSLRPNSRLSLPEVRRGNMGKESLRGPSDVGLRKLQLSVAEFPA